MFDGGGFYGNVGGALPWGGGGGNMLQGLNGSDPMGALAGNYARGYNDVLQMNKSNYNNILEGYQGGMRSQQAAQGALAGGYGQLYGDTMNKIGGIGQARNQEIIDQARAQQGQQNQQLINRGLGNTTVQSAVDRGVNYDRQKMLNQNSESMAGMQAQYMSQLGLAGLRSQENSYQANTGQLNRQLDWMNSVNANYPDAGLYANMAQQYGRGGPNGGGAGVLPNSGGGRSIGGYMPRPYGGGYDGGTAPTAGTGGGGSWLMSQYTSPFGGKQPSSGFGEALGAGSVSPGGGTMGLGWGAGAGYGATIAGGTDYGSGLMGLGYGGGAAPGGYGGMLGGTGYGAGEDSWGGSMGGGVDLSSGY